MRSRIIMTRPDPTQLGGKCPIIAPLPCRWWWADDAGNRWPSRSYYFGTTSSRFPLDFISSSTVIYCQHNRKAEFHFSLSSWWRITSYLIPMHEIKWFCAPWEVRWYWTSLQLFVSLGKSTSCSFLTSALWNKAKKVCNATSVRCYQCFSMHFFWV